MTQILQRLEENFYDKYANPFPLCTQEENKEPSYFDYRGSHLT